MSAKMNIYTLCGSTLCLGHNKNFLTKTLLLFKPSCCLFDVGSICDRMKAGYIIHAKRKIYEYIKHL